MKRVGLILALFFAFFIIGCGGGGGIAGIDTIAGVKEAWNDLIGNPNKDNLNNQALSSNSWNISPNEPPKIAINIGGNRYSNYTLPEPIYVGDTRIFAIDYLSNSNTPTISVKPTKNLVNAGFDSISKKLTISAIKDGSETVEMEIKDQNGSAKVLISLEIRPLPAGASGTISGTIHPNLPLSQKGTPRIAIKAVDKEGKDFYYEENYQVPGNMAIGQKIILDFVYSSKSQSPQIKALAKSKLVNVSLNLTNKQLSIEALQAGKESIELSISDEIGSAKVVITLEIAISSQSSANSQSSASSQSSVDNQSSSVSSQDGPAYLFPPRFAQKTEQDINAICISDELTVQALANEKIMEAKNGVIIKNGEEVGDVTMLKTGDKIKLKLITGDTYFKEYNATATIESKTYTFSCKTKFVKITDPKDFSFIDVMNAKTNTEYTSNEITIEGITVSTQATITNGVLIKNGVALNTKNTTVVNGDRLAIRLKSSLNNDESVSSTLTVGTKSATYTITTEQLPINIMLENQYIGFNRSINIPVKDYIKSSYINDTITCEISGSVPSGLSVDGANCVIAGTTSSNPEEATINIVATSKLANIKVEKSIKFIVMKFESKVLKTGQINSYAPGDDGEYSQKLGLNLGYLSQTNIVKDLTTGLEWQDNESRKLNISEAIDYCLNLKVFNGDAGGWRMPTQEELETINNPVAKNYFKNKMEGYYWSKTQFAGNISNYWYVDYRNGGKSYYLIGTEPNYIRCVRGEKK